MAETDEERIKAMVDRANQLSKEGNNYEASMILEEALNKATYMLPIDAIDRSKGLVYHYKGRVEQAMGRYELAVESLNWALSYRQNNPVDYAYTMFQLFICKIYGKLPITDEEVEETKMALTAAMAKNAASIADIGNMMQNLAYIEQVKGSVEKAITFYKMTLEAREEAGDERGIALTQARLAECYKINGQSYEARDSASFALGYFIKTNDKERIKQVEKVLQDLSESEIGE